MTTRPIDIDALTIGDVRAGALDGRPVTVLGLARSGIALARFLHDMGARVTVYDGRDAAALDGAIGQLGERRRRRSGSARTWTRHRPGPTPRS